MAKKKVKKKSKYQRKLEKKQGNPCSSLWRNKADHVWKELVFFRGDGKCAVCGATEFIQAHHLIPREILVFRHNITNGILLCPKHHKYNFLLSAHKNPIRFALWLMSHQPERWAWLSKTFDPDRGIDLGDGHPDVNFKELYLSMQEALEIMKSSKSSEEVAPNDIATQEKRE